MHIPFTYGKIVSDEDFTDRVVETEKLVTNFLSQTNTALISPRRWGKSSLVNKAIEVTSKSNTDILFVRMNVFKCESPQDFYSVFAKKTIESVSATMDSLLSNAKDFLSRLLPKLSISNPSGQYEISFGIDVKNNPIEEDIIDLPQQIASRKGQKIVVCIDEFQQIGDFTDTAQFQKTLRAHWQEHTDVAYILYGSKKHMLMKIFGDYSSPFYRFGDLMFLPKISAVDWTEYIRKRFSETGKTISTEAAMHIADTVECHSYYVQQLSQYAWLRTEKECTDAVIEDAFQAMLDSMSLQFVNLMDSLTEKQRNFLCAVSDGVRSFSSAWTLDKYKLGTNGNIRILKGALVKRDLIDVSGRKIEIQDPVFNRWIQKEYKKM